MELPRPRRFQHARAAWLLVAILLAVGLSLSLEPGRSPGFDPVVWHLEDPAGELVAEEALDPAAVGRWRVLADPVPNLGHSRSVHWFRTELPPSADMSRWLEIANPLLDRIAVYQTDGRRVLARFETGDHLPFSQRPLPHRHFVFPLADSAEVNQILVRVQTQGAVQLPLAIWPMDRFLAHDQQTLMLDAILAGLLLMVFVFHCLLWVAAPHRHCASLLWFIASTALLQLSMCGLTYQFLWPDAVGWHNHSVAFLIASAAASLSFLTVGFLDLRRRLPRLAMVLDACGWSSVLMLIGALALPISAGLTIANALAMTATATALVASLRLQRDNVAWAGYFAPGLLLFFLGVGLFLLGKYGFIPRNWSASHGLYLGVLALISLLSLAVARRVQREREGQLLVQEASAQQARARRYAQDQVRAVEQTAQAELERHVHARTEQLEAALRQLERANGVLEALSYVDPATGLKNRRFFDETYRLEWRRAYRQSYSLALILVQVERLPEPESGVDCAETLRRVATAVEAAAGRPSDLVSCFDYGVFAVLMAATEVNGATHLAEAVRQHVAALPPQALGPIRVSAGVAALVPSERHHEAVLLSFANEALYQALAAGGDQVRAFRQPLRDESLA